MRRLFAWLLGRMVIQALRQSFRRVCWVGEPPQLPENTPVILYANHQYFHDSYLLWIVIEKMLGRRTMIWMAEWDAFPFFAALGAYPFPSNNARRRVVTVRQTQQAFRERPETMLIYYPEGILHRPDEALLPFDNQTFARFDRLFDQKMWWPVMVHVTWWGEDRPTALMTGGETHAYSTGDEHTRLASLRDQLLNATPESAHVLLEGKTSAAERWRFTFMAGFFKRFL